MRIAIPLADEAGTLAEHFSKSGAFALFDVHDQTRAVAYVGRQSLDQPGCGRTPAFLRQHGVEVVLAHDVSEKAVGHLLEVGIVAIQDAPILTADALIAHLVSGTLQARPPLANEQGGCGSGACGGCCGGGGHTHEHADEHAAEAHGCGSHACAGDQACGGEVQHGCGENHACGHAEEQQVVK